MEKFFPALSSSFSQLLTEIAGKKIAVIGHARPDGDCIGSQVALARILRARGHEVICVNGDPVPRRLQYLIGDLSFYAPATLPSGDWTAIFVDCADHDRGGAKARAAFPTPIAAIDHHLSHKEFAARNIIDAASAATCEILAGIFLDLSIAIDEPTAKALYAGINTDTGQFRFGSTTPRTFKLAAELVTRGASPAEAGYEIYERESWGKLQLLEQFLRSLQLECGGRACIGILPDGVFEKTGTTAEDTEGLVDYARCIDGVGVGVLIEERPDSIKASLRAKDPAMRVDRIAGIFGGGGHACAAGLNLKSGMPIPEFREKIVAAIAAQLAVVDAGK